MKKKKKMNTVAVFTIVIMVLFISVIAIEVVFAIYHEKEADKRLRNYDSNVSQEMRINRNMSK